MQQRFKEIVNLVKTDKFFDLCLGLVVGGVLGLVGGLAYHKDIPAIAGGMALVGGIIGLIRYT